MYKFDQFDNMIYTQHQKWLPRVFLPHKNSIGMLQFMASMILNAKPYVEQAPKLTYMNPLDKPRSDTNKTKLIMGVQ